MTFEAGGSGSSAAPGARVGLIEARLRAALDADAVEVTDDSAKHAGHPGARDGRGHFSVTIVSAAFEGLTRIERHRAVYRSLGALMETDIHALAIRAETPAESSAT